jgi:hypothetical protein
VKSSACVIIKTTGKIIQKKEKIGDNDNEAEIKEAGPTLNSTKKTIKRKIPS